MASGLTYKYYIRAVNYYGMTVNVYSILNLEKVRLKRLRIVIPLDPGLIFAIKFGA